MLSKQDDAVFFLDVVEHGSFTRAARAARVPVSTVSRRVARLETRLGVALLVRTTRKVSLTDAGAAYHAHATRAVAALDEAERAAQDLAREPKGTVRMAAAHGVTLLLWPLVAEFLEAHPGIAIELDAREKHVDLVEERYDLALVTGPLRDSSLVARKVLEGAYALFASPRYLARRGMPRTLAELASHDCIAVGEPSWTLRQKGHTRAIPVRGRLRVNEMGLARRAVLDGHGIGRLPPTMVADDVRAGRLLRVLPRVDGGPVPAWLVYPARRALSASLRALLDHLLDRLPRAYGSLTRR